jgi:8-oxo-dGTP diphosphatase
MQEYVCGLAFDPDGLGVALIEKQHPAWQKGLYNGIGGKIEAGEHPKVAMEREFLEETGVTIAADKWDTLVIITGTDYKVYFYIVFTVSAYDVKTTTDEQVKFLYLQQLDGLSTIDTLDWLIGFALYRHRHGAQNIYIPN